MIDLYALTDAVYRRLKSDAEGASVRAALPGGADAIMLAEDIRLEELGSAQQHPRRPLLCLRRGSTPTVDRVINRPVYTWFVYDDIATGYGRIEQLVSLIAAAYEPLLAIPTVGVGDIEVSAGAQTRSTKPDYLLCPVAVVIGAI